MATMTNAEIIFNKRVELMNAGIIGKTGRKIKVAYTDDDGNTQEMIIDEPEEIHTFQAWKQAGFIVKKGQKAIARFRIWNYTNGKKGKPTPEEEEEEKKSLVKSGYYYMKESFFFTFAQVAQIDDPEPLEKLLPAVYEGKQLPAIVA